jgi:hypothetical protein
MGKKSQASLKAMQAPLREISSGPLNYGEDPSAIKHTRLQHNLGEKGNTPLGKRSWWQPSEIPQTEHKE